MPARNASTAVSILDGTDQIIHECLGLERRQSLRQISTCRKLCNAPLSADFTPEIVPRLFKQIAGNWKGRIPSRENWRHERNAAISDENRSPEVVLERAIVTLAELGDLPEWYNQIPVASGLLNGHSDRRAAVDLVRFEDDTADLIELKWESDTPAFALFEVLRYGLLLLLSRQNAGEFGYSGRPLMEAQTLRLMVLATEQYYRGYDLREIGEIVNHGLGQLSQAESDFPNLSIEFLRFPMGFEIPFDSGSQVNIMRSGGENSARSRLLEAVSQIQPARVLD